MPSGSRVVRVGSWGTCMDFCSFDRAFAGRYCMCSNAFRGDIQTAIQAGECKVSQQGCVYGLFQVLPLPHHAGCLPDFYRVINWSVARLLNCGCCDTEVIRRMWTSWVEQSENKYYRPAWEAFLDSAGIFCWVAGCLRPAYSSLRSRPVSKVPRAVLGMLKAENIPYLVRGRNVQAGLAYIMYWRIQGFF